MIGSLIYAGKHRLNLMTFGKTLAIFYTGLRLPVPCALMIRICGKTFLKALFYAAFLKFCG